MIHILDKQTDILIEVLDNDVEGKLFWGDVHHDSINNLETFDFTARADVPGAQHLTGQNRIIIPADKPNAFKEFIIFNTFMQTGGNIEVKSNGSYLELAKDKIMTAFNLGGQTPEQAMAYGLQGTNWEVGNVEYSDKNPVIASDERMDAYQYLLMIAETYGMQLDFRVQTHGNRIVGRFVDLLHNVGNSNGKEIVLGKDLVGIVRQESTDDLITALVVEGPPDEYGGRVSVNIVDDDALQRWGRDGRHRWDYFEVTAPEGVILKEADVRAAGQKELDRRMASVVQYTVDAVSLEHVFGLSHERALKGDMVRIKDESFVPPLYLDARLIDVKRSLSDPSAKEFTLGEFIEYSADEVMSTFRQLRNALAKKVGREELEGAIAEVGAIIKQPTPPLNPKLNTLWLDTSRVPNVLYRWNDVTWVKASPTVPDDIGAVPPEYVDNKVDGAIEAVVIGGTNLHRQSNFALQALNAYPFTINSGIIENIAAQAPPFTSALKVVKSGTAKAGHEVVLFQGSAAAGKLGKSLTTSMWIKYTNIVRGANTLDVLKLGELSIDYLDASGVAKNAKQQVFALTGTSDWDEITKTIKIGAGITGIKTITKITSRFVNEGASGTHWITGIMIEEATKRSAWTESQSDIIDYTDATADFITQQASEFTSNYAQKRISQSLTAPANPVNGDFWIDISKTPHVWKRWNGAIWANASATSLAELDGLLETNQIAVGAVTTGVIADGAITAGKLLDDAVTSAKIAAGAITESKVGTGAVTNTKLAALAVDAAKLAANAVTTDKILDSAISGAKVAANAITELKINPGAITNSRMADLAIDAAKLAAGAVTNAKLADNAVTGTKILDDAISAGKIAANAVTELKINPGAVTNTRLANLAVDAAKLAAGAVTETKLGTGAVTSAKILDAAIITAKLAAGAVTELKIGDSAITNTKLAALAVDAEKLADSAVTATKIANLAVGTAAIQDAAITNAKVGELDASKITTGRLDAGRVQIGAGTEFAAGFDPSTKETPEGATAKAAAAQLAAINSAATDASTKATAAETAAKVAAAADAASKAAAAESAAKTAAAADAKTKADAAQAAAIAASKTDASTKATAAETAAKAAAALDATAKAAQAEAAAKAAAATDAQTKATTAQNAAIAAAKTYSDSVVKPANDRLNLWKYLDTTFIDGGSIFTNTITANQIAVGAITAASGILANAAVGTAIIADAAITSAKIANLAVGTAAIADAAITNAKIKELDAEKITTGRLDAARVQIGSGTTFAAGFDPTSKETPAGAQAKATAAQTAAVTAAATDATSKANAAETAAKTAAAADAASKAAAAESAAKTAAALDAKAKADAAQAAAITAAGTDAASKAAAAETAAKTFATSEAVAKAAAAEAAAKLAAATDAKSKADAAQAAAIAAAKTDATTKADAAETAAINAAKSDATTKANAAQAAAIAAAKTDATTKADAAESAAKTAAALDAASKAAAAESAAKTAAAADAKTKADAAQAAAIAAGKTDASTKATAAETAAKTYAAAEAAAKAASAEAAAKAAAATDATSKANAAQTAATAAAKTYSDSVVKPANDRLALWQYADTTFIDGGDIYTNTITANQIAVGAITAASGIIADAAITNAKIANAAITSAKIGTAAVGTAAIADAAITNAKILNLDAAKITTGRLDAARVQIGSGTQFADGFDPTTKATPEYVQSRGENLVTNGTGLLGDNTNFSQLTFDGSQVYAGGGSFKTTLQNGTRLSDELIPVDTSKKYRISLMAKSDKGIGHNYFGVGVYDIDGLSMSPYNYYGGSFPVVELIKPLKVGDTIVHLSDVSGFMDDSPTPDHRHSLIMYGYKNSFGYEYPAGTYSRFDFGAAWNVGAIDRVNKTITFNKPFSVTNPHSADGSFPIGHKLSATQSGGSYKYTAASNVKVPTDWAYYEGIINGLAPDTRSNAFAPGTAFIKILFLTNRSTSGGQAGDTLWVNSISVTDITQEENAKVYADAAAKPANDRLKLWAYLDTTYIDGGDIYTNTITANQIATGTITAASGIIADAAITSAKIANLAVGTAAIQDAAITNAKIKDLHADKITAGTISAARIQIGATTTFAAGFDPSEKETPSGALAKATAAETAAKTAAAADATAKAAAAESAAKTAAALDAKTKADAAQAAAIAAAKTDASTKATAAETAAKTFATSEAAAKAAAAEAAAKLAAATDAKTKADAAQAAAIAASGTDATSKADAAEAAAKTAAAADAASKAAAAESAAKTAAAADAKTKADAAQAAAIAAGKTDATTKANAAEAAAKAAAALDATAKAAAAESAAKTAAAADATSKANAAEAAAKAAAATDAQAKATAAKNEAITAANSAATAAAKHATDRVNLWTYTGTTFIDGGDIYANSVTANQLSANSVTASQIAALSIAAGAIQANAVSADKLAVNAVTADKIAANAITAVKIAANAITADKIAANSITSNLITTAGLDAAVIKFGTMTGITADLGLGGITATGTAASSVRLWAGSSFAARDAAPFRVTQDGAVYASNMQIVGGTIDGARMNTNNANGTLWTIVGDGQVEVQRRSGFFANMMYRSILTPDELSFTGTFDYGRYGVRRNVASGTGTLVEFCLPDKIDFRKDDATFLTIDKPDSVNSVITAAGRLMLATNAGKLELYHSSGGDTIVRGYQNGNAASLLKWSATGLQVRIATDGSLASIQASAFSTSSLEKYKKDIKPFGGAIQKVRDAKIYDYVRTETEEGREETRQIGLLHEEAPDDVKDSDETIDLYSMISVLWKAVQELADVVESSLIPVGLVNAVNNPGFAKQVQKSLAFQMPANSEAAAKTGIIGTEVKK